MCVHAEFEVDAGNGILSHWAPYILNKKAHEKLIFVRVFMVAIEILNYDDFMSFTKKQTLSIN